MRLENQQLVRYRREGFQVLLRILQVVEEAAAEDGIEEPVVGDVEGVVVDEPEIRQVGLRFDVVAGRHVQLANLDPEDLKSHAREPDRVPAFKQPTSARRRWLLSPGKTVSRIPRAEMNQDDSSNVREDSGIVKVPSSRRTLWAVNCTAPAECSCAITWLAPSAGPGFVDMVRLDSRVGAGRATHPRAPCGSASRRRACATGS